MSEPTGPTGPTEPIDDADADPDADAESEAPEQGGFGLPDLGGLLEGMQRMQEAQGAHYVGRAGGGAVQIEASGSLEFTSVAITAEALSTGDVELVQDLVLAALHDLTERVAAAHRQAVGELGDLGLGNLSLGDVGLGGPDALAGLGLGGLGGLDAGQGDDLPIDVAPRDDPPGP